MPSTKEITVYTFNELDDRAKDKVRSWFTQDVDLSYVVDNAKERGAEKGFIVEDVQYSLSYSQGDGASWTGSVNALQFIEQHIPPDHRLFARCVILAELIREGWAAILIPIDRRSYMYSHSNTMATGDWHHVDPEDAEDGEPLRISKGILEGADARELALSIGFGYLSYEIQEEALAAAKKFADEIYKDLREAYEWEISDEHIAECAEINDWQFDADGQLV